MQLLHVDSSITGAQSVSRQVSASIVARLVATIPRLDITYRDLAASPLPQYSEAVQRRKARPADAAGDQETASPDLEQSVEALDAALDEFLAADIVVIGAPMYNFGIPSQLKSWIDALSVAGKTFSYSAAGATGLCGGKRIVVASSRGGYYAGDAPMASLDHQETYLSGMFGFLGVTDIGFVRAEGINYGPEQRQRSLESALAEVAALRAP